MRLALGTVQFGLHYGVSNTDGQVGIDAAARILDFASERGVDTLDTASAYGSSEEVLGQIGVRNWRVISKIPPLPNGVCDVQGWVISAVKQSLARLKIESLDAVLVHKPSDLSGVNQRAYLDGLDFIKAQGLASAVGYSIYSPDELESLTEIRWPDLVQAPFSVLDRRLKTSGWLDRLNEYGTLVHARSVFLQGLLLMPTNMRPPWFARWEDVMARWDRACAQSGLSRTAMALNFALNEPGIEKVVVGVESKEQLEQIFDAGSTDVEASLLGLACSDVDLIEPYRWNLQ